jgi:2-polyprenyl-3-methyl-5-hydroxy-6-metoxy-1,4-benzoquinol methylase
MKTISDYNRGTKFSYELQESRLKKCAKIIAGLRPGRMLDLGCSDGTWGAYWRDQGWECAGIDIDQEHLHIAQRRGIDARHCDLNQSSLPFADQSFDLIFAGEVIEHLIDTDGFLAELRRCVRPGGHILLTTPNLISFENRLRILLGIYPIWVNYNLSGSGHVRAYTPRVLKKQLQEHGFRVILHTGNWVPFIPQRFVNDIDWPRLAFTGDLFPNLAMDIIMLGRRDDQPGAGDGTRKRNSF